MRKRNWGGLLALIVALAGAGPSAASGLSDDGRVGMVADLQGTLLVRPVGRQRWSPIGAQTLLLPGDEIRTMLRGAHAAEIRMRGGASIVLGAGARVKLEETGKLRVFSGDVEVGGDAAHALQVTGPGGFDERVTETVVLRVQDDTTARLAEAPRWLAGYRDSTTDEWMGSLVAKVDGRDVPLSVGYHKVDVVIRDQIAVTTIEESFVNATPARLEGVFSFPLPAGASISGFGMWIGDELVQADIVERQRARAIYEDIRRRKKDPGLLEWSGGNLFKASVFPIEPHGEKRIRLRYTQVLPLEGSRVRYRYALRSELLRTNPLRRLQIRVRNHSSAPISAVSSPTHDVVVSQSEHTATVEFDAVEHTPERDLEVVFEQEATSPLRVVPHRRGEDGYFMLMVSPDGAGASGLKRELIPENGPVDVLFVADTSGSMGPRERREQRDFLASALALLGPEDHFRLMACDATRTWIVEEPTSVDEENVTRALEALDHRISMGWTDLRAALSDAASRTSGETLVVYVGDGIETTGDADPVALAQWIARMKTPSGISFHAVATGTAYEEGVLAAIAQMGTDGTTRATDGDPAATAYALLSEVAQPGVKDVRVEFEGLRTARVYPGRMPRLPAGRQQVVLGRFLPSGDGAQSGKVVVTGTLDGKAVRYSAPLTLAEDEDGNSFLPRLWARKHLDALLAEGRTPAIEEEIVSFSERFGIMTPYTSFLVLESDEDRARYGVTRRVHVRDGERFFSDAKAAANTEALREQVTKARSWRMGLRRRMLAEIAGLGRNLYTARSTYAYGMGGGAGGGSGGTWDSGVPGAKSGVYRGPAGELGGPTTGGGDAGFDHDEVPELEEEVPPDSRDPSDPPPPPGEPPPVLEPDQEWLSKRRSSAREQVADYGGPTTPGGPGGPVSGGAGRSAGRFRSDAPFEGPGYDRDGGRSRWPWIRSLPFQRFPPLAPASTPTPHAGDPPPWTDEVLAVLATVAQPQVLGDDVAGGLRVSYADVMAQPQYLGAPSSTGEGLVGRERWRIVTSQLGQESIVRWLSGDRGVHTAGTRLGRRRAGAENDRIAWGPLLGRHAADYARTYAAWAAEIVARDDDLVSVKLTPPEPRTDHQLLVIDVAKGVIARSESHRDGTLVSTHHRDDWQLAGGLWWARAEWTVDAAGKESWRRRLTVEELSADALVSALDAEIAKHADVLFIGLTDPDVATAKQAIHDAEATVADHLAMVGAHASFQRWGDAWLAFEAARAAAAGKPGIDWIEPQLLQHSRRGERHVTLAHALIDGVAARTDREARPLAALLLQVTTNFHPNERLVLVDRLAAVGPHDAATPTGRWWKRFWQGQRASLLFSIGDRDTAIAIWRGIWEEDPANPHTAAALINPLAQTGDLDGALEVIDALEEAGGTWPPYQVQGVFRQLAYVLWNALRYDDLQTLSKRWIAAAPEDASAYHVWLTTLVAKERIDECDAWIGGQLDGAEDVGEDAVARAKLAAAVSMALGNEWNGSWYGHAIDEKWSPRLAEVARVLARQNDGDASTVSLIVNDQRHNRTDTAVQLRSWLREDLVADGAIESLTAERLAQYVGWLRWDRNSVDTVIWRGVTDRVIARWRAEENVAQKRSLFNTALGLLDVRFEPAEAADLLREALGTADETEATGLARILMARLVTLPWTQALEDELFALVPRVVTGETPEPQKRHDYSAYAHWIADQLFDLRVEADLGPPEVREKLPRAELRANQKTARKNARVALAERFATAAEGAPEMLRPWYEIERISYLAELGRSTDVEGEAREMLLSIATDPDGAVWVLRERSVLALSYVAVRRGAPEGLADRVLALLREKVAAEDETLDWRYSVFRLLIVLDRPAELEQTLQSWIVPSRVESRWRIALGYVLAELERLAEAVPVFEEVAKLDELDEPQYVMLADWYLVLGDDAARERTLDRRLRVVNEYELRSRVQREMYRVQPRRGTNEPPPDLDDEILRVIRVMLSKSSRPEQAISPVYSLYRALKDPRLLASLADGVVGHTPEAIYPYLHTTNGLINQVHEEATCDEIRERIAARLDAVTTDTDRRGLQLLLSQVERRAGEVLDQPGPHMERSLRHLRSARKGDWLPGEPRLMAEYLEGLGKIPHPALAEEQVAQLRELHNRAEPGSHDRLLIARHTYLTIWRYGDGDAAIDGLTAAIDEHRSAQGGVFPASLNYVVELSTGWMENRKYFGRAEKRLLAGHARQIARAQREWYARRTYRLYVHCLGNGGSVSIGSGTELYSAARDLLRAALADHGPDQLQEVLNLLCGLHDTAKKKRIGASKTDLLDFSRTLFPELMPRFGTQQAGATRRLAEAIKDVAGRRDALAFLIDRHEAEKPWRRRRGLDGWGTCGNQMALWRRELGQSIGDLEPRLLVIVLRELERDLVTQRSRGRYMYGNVNNRDFWTAKKSEFLGVVRRVLAEHASSAGRTLYAAQFLWDGLRERGEAIGALQAADTRRVLREDGRWTLVGWLQHQKRWAEMLPHAERLVGERPDNLAYRIANIRALHGVGRDDEGRALVTATYEHFDAMPPERRHRHNHVQQLAAVCLKSAYHDLAVTYYGEAIRDHERRIRGRIGPNGDGHLSSLYEQLAQAHAALGQHDEAIDAATSAVVVMGSHTSNRARALASLRTALAAVPDLDAWIAAYDAEVVATGTDAPVIRRALTKVFLDRKDAPRAIRQARAALRHYPDDVELHAQVIAGYRLAEDSDGRSAAIADALFHVPAQPKLYAELSALLRAQGDEVGADRALSGLAEYAPNESEGHQSLAQLLTNLGRHAEAVVQWSQVVRIRTKEIEGWLALARAQSAAGDHDGAVATLDEVAAQEWAKEHAARIAATRKQVSGE